MNDLQFCPYFSVFTDNLDKITNFTQINIEFGEYFTEFTLAITLTVSESLWNKWIAHYCWNNLRKFTERYGYDWKTDAMFKGNCNFCSFSCIGEYVWFFFHPSIGKCALDFASGNDDCFIQFSISNRGIKMVVFFHRKKLLTNYCTCDCNNNPIRCWFGWFGNGAVVCRFFYVHVELK